LIIFSKQVCLYVLKNHSSLINKVYFSKEIDNKIFKQFARLNKDIIKVDNKKAQSMSRGGNHQGMFLEIDDIELKNKLSLKEESNFIIVLYKVTDIGNIGSIIRTALALNCSEVVISGIKGSSIEGIIRTSLGSFFDINVSLIEDTMPLINFLKQNKFTCYGTDSKGNPTDGLVAKSNKALFVGNEHEGLSGKVLSKMDDILSIEMFNGFDSLNVACATSILIDRLNRFNTNKVINE